MDIGMFDSHEAEALMNEALNRIWLSRIAERAKTGIHNPKDRNERVKEIAGSIAEAANHGFRIEVAASVGVGSIGFNAVAHSEENLVRISEKMVDALTDDGLALVIAHEAVHLKKGHGYRKVAYGKDLKTRLANALEEFSATQKDGNPKFLDFLANLAIAVVVAVGVILLLFQGFSRFLETEADTEAVSIVEEAGFDAGAGVEELVQILRDVAHVPTLAAIIASHPSTRAREKRMRKALAGGWSPKGSFFSDKEA